MGGWGWLWGEVEAHYNDVFEIVNSVDQGNFTFVGEKVGNLKKSMTVASMWTN